MNRWLGLVAAAAVAATAGCTKQHVESISYETGPCFGTCPVYVVTVHADGTGLFDGKRFTKVMGQKAFTVTHAQYAQYVNHLAPVRPASGVVRYDGPPECTSMVTDLPSADVKWKALNGQQQELYFYYGCRFTNSQAMADRLSKAPDLLPIASFIH